MATIFHYGPYAVVSATGALRPGAEDTWVFGPWPWYAFVVEVTAHPIALLGDDRHLQVTRISSEANANGDRLIWATVKNIGPNPANYAWWLGGIQP
jgi:hypothetical protein